MPEKKENYSEENLYIEENLHIEIFMGREIQERIFVV